MTLTSFLRLSPLFAALLLASCGTPKQSMNLTGDALTTPSHSMSHGEYPFDDGGQYVDNWASEGAGRYPASMDSDRSDEGRKRTVARPTKTASRSTKTTGRSSQTASTAKSSKSGKTGSKTKSRSVTVTVKKTDTLYGLAKRYGTSVGAIKSANGLKSNALRPGRSLTIPR